MLREDYKNNYKKLKITKLQKKEICCYIEDNLLIYTTEEFDIGFSDCFNDLFFFILGSGDTKDMFQETDETIVNIKNIKKLILLRKKLELIKNLTNYLKSTLNQDQINELKILLNILYVKPEKYIKNEKYLSNQYIKGKITAQFYLLKEIEK
jgi:hypothetical protein